MTRSKTCAQDGAGNPIECGQPIEKRRRCGTHYQQWYRLQTKCRADGCKRIQAAHYYCRPHERLALSSRPAAAQARTLQLFRGHIEPDQETGCWLWTGATNDNGYGLFSAGGTWLAHRFSYVWFYGGTAPRRVLDHLCAVDVRCVRPDHLWPVTNGTNTRLMHQRTAAGGVEFWRHSRITPYSLPMIQWAMTNGLPWGKPAAPAALTARDLHHSDVTNRRKYHSYLNGQGGPPLQLSAQSCTLT